MNKEYHKNYMQEWRKNNPDYYKNYMHEWRKNNPDKVKIHYAKQKIYLIEWRKRNPEKVKVYNDKNKEKEKEWRKNNKERIKEIKKKYRIEKKLELKLWRQNYKKTEKAKEFINRYHAKRYRNKKWIKLFPNIFPENEKIDFHHINNIFVVALPKKIHQSCNNGSNVSKHFEMANSWVEFYYGIHPDLIVKSI